MHWHQQAHHPPAYSATIPLTVRQEGGGGGGVYSPVASGEALLVCKCCTHACDIAQSDLTAWLYCIPSVSSGILGVST